MQLWLKASVMLNKGWYGRSRWAYLLLPLSLFYTMWVQWRRFYLTRFRQQHFSIPIIVVGNLTVGGVGKTPLVIALAQAAIQRGWRVGIVSRGYGSSLRHFPYKVHKEDSATLVGDEPLLIAQKTACPVVIAPQRVEAVRYLLDHYSPQLIISDDGLQHYAMGRAIEIAVIDGERGLGNELLLPAGPLREKKHRLQEVDFLVANGGSWPEAYRMEMVPLGITSLQNRDMQVAVDTLQGPIAAIAGIGYPARFFSLLKNIIPVFNAYTFADHYLFRPQDLFSLQEKTVVMTEKDAVKCCSFATMAMYVLSVEAQLSDAFWEALWSHKALSHHV